MSKVRFNLYNVHYAMLKEGEDGAVTYDKPKAILGSVSLELSAKGDSSTLYADGRSYYVTHANNGYDGSLEMALLPDEFKTDCLGFVKGANGEIIEDAAAEPKKYALLYQVDTDDGPSVGVLYNCTSGRPDISAKTNEEKKSLTNDKLPITALPLPRDKDGRMFVKSSASKSDEAFTTWFDAVTLPTVASTVTG